MKKLLTVAIAAIILAGCAPSCYDIAKEQCGSDGVESANGPSKSCNIICAKSSEVERGSYLDDESNRATCYGGNVMFETFECSDVQEWGTSCKEYTPVAIESEGIVAHFTCAQWTEMLKQYQVN